MRNRFLDEFHGLTNDKVYVKVFADRIMKPIPGQVGEFLGCDQRMLMKPTIHNLVAALPMEAEVFDVGAGSGDVVDFALKDAPKGTVVNIEEPNPLLLNKYVERLKQYSHLHLGIAHEGPIQDCYVKKMRKSFPQRPQQLILAIHMIYHLTDFTKNHTDPINDLVEALSFLYNQLADGGAIFIVYADLASTDDKHAVCSIGEHYFREKFPQEPFAANLAAIFEARNTLLGANGTIGDHLQKRFPTTRPLFYSMKQHSHFFGATKEDIAVLALAGELCPSNDKLFDIAKLQYCLDYIERHPEKIDLASETADIPQKGMWRAHQPQVLAVITKQKG